MDRLLNYSFALILIYIFALWAPASIHGVIILGVIASLAFCSLAFVLGWLTLDGAAAAMVVGTITFGFGGWPMVMVVICFFVSSTFLSIKDSDENAVIRNERRRNGLQVWANGFWLVTWLLAGIITNLFVCWMGAVAVLATATADTWATELGSRRFRNTQTYLITTRNHVSPGTEGGVSWPGIIAALLGSLFIAMVAAFGFSLSAGWFTIIAISGFLGSVLDSYIGAQFQGTSYILQLPGFAWQKKLYIDNNVVNWMATGFGSILLLILNQFFL